MASPQSFNLRRKPVPNTDPRYPSPDPLDPFAPLWVLRSRASSRNLETTYNANSGPNQATAGTSDSGRTLHYHRRRTRSSPITSLASEITVTDNAHTQTYHVFMSSAQLESGAISVPADNFLQHVNPPLQHPKPLLVKARSFAPHATEKRSKQQTIKSRSQSLADNLRGTATSPQRNSVAGEKYLHKRLISSPAHFKHQATGNEIQFSHCLVLNEDAQVEPYQEPLSSTSPPLRKRGPSHEAIDVLAQHQLKTISSTASLPLDSPPIRSAHTLASSTMYDRQRPSTSSGSSQNDARMKRRSRRVSKLNPLDLPLDSTASQGEWSLPDEQALSKAASLPVIAESGVRVPFGSLLTAERTIVIFLRHFWCPQCQDYMASLTSLAHPELMVTDFTPPTQGTSGSSSYKRIQLIVIGNGSHSMITKYRRMFKTPFNMYTDPSLSLYLALGMGRLDDIHSVPPDSTSGLISGGEKRIQDGGYRRHGSVGSFAAVLGRALKVGMPVWADGGDKQQLGGEFIFGPGLTCTYAHRMQSARGHVPAGDVLAAAGIDLPSLVRLQDGELPSKPSKPRGLSRGPSLLGNGARIFQGRRKRTTLTEVPETPVEEPRIPSFSRRRSQSLEGTVNSRSAFVMVNEEEEEWMAERMQSLERLREKKNQRRGTFAGFNNEAEASYVLSKVCPPVDERDEHIFIANENGVSAFASVTVLPDPQHY